MILAPEPKYFPFEHNYCVLKVLSPPNALRFGNPNFTPNTYTCRVQIVGGEVLPSALFTEAYITGSAEGGIGLREISPTFVPGTIFAYKLLRVRRDGTLGPLFINKNQVIKRDQWYDAEDHPTKGYAHRPGWHCTLHKDAPHLSKKNRRWYRVTILGAEEHARPANQGGTWLIAKKMMVIGPAD